MCSYAAALKAYGDVGRRIAAAIKTQVKAAASHNNTASDIDSGSNDTGSPRGVDAKVHVVHAASADVQVDHHLLGAAIQTQVPTGLLQAYPGA